jgi:hypothetical protein
LIKNFDLRMVKATGKRLFSLHKDILKFKVFGISLFISTENYCHLFPLLFLSPEPLRGLAGMFLKKTGKIGIVKITQFGSSILKKTTSSDIGIAG